MLGNASIQNRCLIQDHKNKELHEAKIIKDIYDKNESK
jgi:hypothetical protein